VLQLVPSVDLVSSDFVLFRLQYLDTRAVNVTDKISGTKRYIFLAVDAQLAEFLAAVRIADGLAAEALCSLLYVNEDGDRIQQQPMMNLQQHQIRYRLVKLFAYLCALERILESMLHQYQQFIMNLIRN
ncbi:MAG: hypothetical protein EZS28_043915, partial [Streblomastix strix]